MERHVFSRMLGILLLFLVLPGLGWSVPDSMTVTGRLLDKDGQPIIYMGWVGERYQEISPTLPVQMKFYDSMTTTTSIYTLDTTTNPFGGYFSISFALPWSVLEKDELFYTLAIDADRNGLTSADLFAGRFQISSVPYALTSKPARSFTTHGGQADNPMTAGIYANLMQVAPFETPAGGVEFNRMNIEVVNAVDGCSFEFGIFSEDGKLAASSGRINVRGASIYNAFLEIKLPKKIKLEPSKIYYTGFARNTNSPALRPGLKPGTPTWGLITIPAADGSIPSTFDPATLDPDDDAIPLPITLWLSTKTSAAALAGADETKPQARWIYTKKSKVIKTTK